MNISTQLARGTLAVLFAIFFISTAWAQDRTITGTVTSEAGGEPLPGVNVVVKGTTIGTITDIDGNYQLQTEAENPVLQFSFIGYGSQEVEVGNQSTINVTLSDDVQSLQEVVVTAQGIEREKKALGYAVATVEGEKLEKQPQADVGRILQGKVSGASITASNGVSGSGTNIVIRGYSSITGSNQPLFVVDGVPFNSATNTDNSASDFQQGALGTSSRFLDLDPNNIASVNVLKGLSAATLYGEQGRNGVILVTTKNGTGGLVNEKMAVTLNQSFFFNEIASLPDYQNNYGGGFHQNFGFFFSNWGPNFNTRGQRGIDADGNTVHPLSRLTDPTLRAQFPEFQDQDYAYRAYEDPGGFFRTGQVLNTSVNIRGAGEKVNYSATFSYTNDEGFTPNNSLEKFNFGLGGNVILANKLSLNSTFNFAITDMQTPPISASQGSSAIGQGESIFGDVFYTPRNVDLINLPFVAPLDGRPVYYRSGNDITNPFWTANFARNTDDVNRFFSKTSLVYDITENINVQYRLGLDTYSEQLEWYINRGSNTQAEVTPGVYRTNNINNTIWNQDLIITGEYQVSEDLNVSAVLGGNYRYDRFERRGLESVNQRVFDFINHANFISTSPFNSFSGLQIQRLAEEKILAAYGQITLDYRDFLFINAAARNDWSSTVEEDNRSLFYPSASLSFVPTSAFDFNENVVNFLKFRVGFGQSAGFPDPYSTRNVLVSTARAFVTNDGSDITTNSNAVNLGTNDNGASATLGKFDLKPERHQEWELGVEGQFVDNRFGLSATVYRKITQDLITQAPIDPSVGFTTTFLNLGEIENRGLELEVNAALIRTGNFSWDVSANFFTYETTVNDLGADLDQVTVAGFTNLGNFAIEDEPFNVIQGSQILRNDAGQPIIGSDGLYQPTPEIDIIGDPNPDFTTSIFTTVRWKGLSLNAQFDYRRGGDIYSVTANTLIGRGITEDTDFDRTQAYVLDGVDAEGNPNRQVITATNLGFGTFVLGPDELYVYDGTTLRLREISLGYTLPTSILEKTPFGQVSVTLIGNNLWFRSVNFPEHLNFDTDVTSLNAGGNGLGFDFLTGPTSRRYGFNVSLTF